MPTNLDPPLRRALALAAAVGACLVAALGIATSQASAAYTARVQGGTLQLTGDGAADTLVLQPAPPSTLVVTLNGAPFDTFDTGAITAVSVQTGGGDDTFQWDPGDGSDTVEGQGGGDVLAFNGSNIGEEIGVAANGPRVRLTRNVGAITMDVDGSEPAADTLRVNTLGGRDTVAVSADVNDLITPVVDLGADQ
jgi:hypothetical protein